MNNKFNEIYYILRQDSIFEEFSVDPSESASNLDYDYEELIFGTKPLYFELEIEDLNELVEEYVFLYDGPSFLVNTKLKSLIDFGLYQSQFFPAVITDEVGNSREDFWVLNTFGMLDSLNDNESSIRPSHDDSSSADDLVMAKSVLRYSLDEKVLSLIPEQERLIFKMGNTSTQPIFVHQKIVDIFQKNNVKGVKFFRVSDYEFGDEF